MIINIMIKVFKICFLSLYVQNFHSNITTLVSAKFEMGDSFRYFLFNLFKLWTLQSFFNLQY